MNTRSNEQGNKTNLHGIHLSYKFLVFAVVLLHVNSEVVPHFARRLNGLMRLQPNNTLCDPDTVISIRKLFVAVIPN